ncbi:MAG: hypothetical protein F6K41_06030 [Symploca sp. SIO3E6]|nr:hypothetical protein [Caldora sp. SIO3E6]
MRNYLYFWIGIIASIFGWSVAQFLVVDLRPFWENTNLTFFLKFPYTVRFVIITSFLAIGIVKAEVFLSHPTRIKAGLRIIRWPLFMAISSAILSGLLSALISYLLKLSPLPAFFIRLVDWILIGIAVGFAEGTSWYLRSLVKEELDVQQVQKRLFTSCLMGLLGSITAFIISERYLNQDLISFMLLGGLLGGALSVTSSPSSQPALRAGEGFEPTRSNSESGKNLIRGKLKFANNSRTRKIEEGLSIELPKKGEVLIGSDSEAQIYISDLPQHSAKISIDNDGVWIFPCDTNGITMKNRQLLIEPCINPEEQGGEKLRHNQIITFKTQSNTEIRKHVRFVYYDRFLDPEA